MVDVVDVVEVPEGLLGFLMAGVAHETDSMAMHIAMAANRLLENNFFIIAYF